MYFFFLKHALGFFSNFQGYKRVFVMIQSRVFPVKTEFFTHSGWKGEDHSKNIVQ